MTRAIHRYTTIDSTMRRAVELANEGAPSGTAVVAGQQTAGRGRYGRSWHSTPKDGLYVSVILRVGMKLSDIPVTTLALGLAAVYAIERVAGIHCDLRWPNDVMIADRKCAGILAELHDDAIVAGIGINVNNPSLPPDIASLATSIRLATGRQTDIEDLLESLLTSIDDHIAILTSAGPAAIIEAFTHASSYARGRRVIVDSASNAISGTTAGLSSEGFLLVTDAHGRRHTIIAGGVRPVT